MRLTDLQYHSIGEDGLYWRLRAEGAVNSRIVTDAEIQHAMQHPPEGTRAWRRGMEIAKLQNREVAHANWMLVQEPGRRLVLNDPVQTDVEWIVDAPKASVK
jgi:proteasome accessory factor A